MVKAITAYAPPKCVGCFVSCGVSSSGVFSAGGHPCYIQLYVRYIVVRVAAWSAGGRALSYTIIKAASQFVLFLFRCLCFGVGVLVRARARAHADVVRIQSFAPTVEVITWSKQRPRRMTIHGGERIRHLNC